MKEISFYKSENFSSLKRYLKTAFVLLSDNATYPCKTVLKSEDGQDILFYHFFSPNVILLFSPLTRVWLLQNLFKGIFQLICKNFELYTEFNYLLLPIHPIMQIIRRLQFMMKRRKVHLYSLHYLDNLNFLIWAFFFFFKITILYLHTALYN